MSADGIKSPEGLKANLLMIAAAGLGHEIERLFEVYFGEVTERPTDDKSRNALDTLDRGMRRAVRAYKAANALIESNFNDPASV